MRRTVVRCDNNKYHTPLFSYDNEGIYIRCKDCRTLDPSTQQHRRGPFHLIRWSQLATLMNKSGEEMVGFIVGERMVGIGNDATAQPSSSSTSPDSASEGADSDNGSSGDEYERGEGDQGGRLAGDGLPVSMPTSPDAEPVSYVGQ